jgi:hypothetical protein
MNLRSQKIGIYCGWGFLVLFMVGFLIVAHFFPPPGPWESARQIQERFQHDTLRIRLGMLICLFSGALLLWWWATITTQIRRIEGPHSPVTYIQIAGGAAFVIEFVYPLMFYAVAAFRPDDSAELVRKFNDLAWLCLLGIVSTAIVQIVAFGYAVVTDKREQPIYPRWFAYFSFWAALLFFPADLIFFFHHGPLAWNGLISFYLVFIVFGAWIVVTTVMTDRAIDAQALESPDVAGDSAELAEQVRRMQHQLDELTARLDKPSAQI